MSKTRKAMGYALNALLGVAVVLVTLAYSSHYRHADLSSKQAQLPTASTPIAYSVATTVQAADLALASITATPLPGEGMIRITTRVCGSADTWQANAAANGITAPVYLVLLGQSLTISCNGAAAPAPAPTQPTPPAVIPHSGWVAPLQACISSPFGWAAGRSYFHGGVDIAAGWGTPIHAIAAGTISVGWQAGGAGNYSMINHGGGIWSVYMHQSSYAVTSGWVNAGQVIGYVGATGDAQGAHLHLEVHTAGLWNGKVDPLIFLGDRGIWIGSSC